MIGIPLSTVFGGPVAGMLLGLDGWHGLQGWQWLFVLEGLPAVIFGVVTWFWLPDTPRDVRWLSAAEQQHVEKRVADEHAAVRERHAGSGSLRTALLHPTVWLLCFVLFACQCGSYGLTLWIPQIVKNLSGLSDLDGGLHFGDSLHRRHGGDAVDRRQFRSQRRALPACGAAELHRCGGLCRQCIHRFTGAGDGGADHCGHG